MAMDLNHILIHNTERKPLKKTLTYVFSLSKKKSLSCSFLTQIILAFPPYTSENIIISSEVIASCNWVQDHNIYPSLKDIALIYSVIKNKVLTSWKSNQTFQQLFGFKNTIYSKCY